MKYLIGLAAAIAIFAAGFFAGSYIKNADSTHNLISILDRIQAMSNLTTMRYSYDNILTSARELPPILSGLYGDRLVMVVRGEINAGINLQALTEESFSVNDDILTVRLPPAELHDCFFNEQQSRVISRDTGLFARPAPNLDSSARLYTIGQVRDSALDDGILEKAQVHSEQLIIDLLYGIVGDEYREIRVISEPQPSIPVLPPTCQ